MLTYLPKAPVIIIGTHRSGTSIFTELLSHNGIFIGNDLRAHFESATFFSINEQLMRKANATWSNPAPLCDALGDERESFVQDAKRLIKKNLLSIRSKSSFATLRDLVKLNLNYYSNWGWKDPRTCITLPVWLDIFPKATIIHIFRNGIDVALSMQKRESERKKSDYLYTPQLQNLDMAFSLWEGYERTIDKNTRGLPQNKILRIRYEDLIERDENTLNKLEMFLRRNLVVPQSFFKPGRQRASTLDNIKYYRSEMMIKLGYEAPL